MSILNFIQAAGVKLRSIKTVVQTWIWRRNPRPTEVFYFKPGEPCPVIGTAKLFDTNGRAFVITESGVSSWVPVTELFRRAA